MDDTYRRLLAELDVATALLAKHGHEHWVRWLTADRARLQQGDARGLSHLLAAYGGMGSLPDVRLEAIDDDGRLSRALSQIHDAIRELQRTEGMTPDPPAEPHGSATPSRGGPARSAVRPRGERPRAVRAWKREGLPLRERLKGRAQGFDVMWEDGAVDHDVNLDRVLDGARFPADYWAMHHAACRSAPAAGAGPWVTYPYGHPLDAEDSNS